jgi:putative transposase
MKEHASAPTYKRHRFPPAISGHALWRYFRFARSYRAVEEPLAARGVLLPSETVRPWCRKCGQVYANELRRRRPQPGDKWHLDEVFVSTNGTQHSLWRAVGQGGKVLAILVPARRDKQAATKSLRKLLKGSAYAPRVVIMDRLASDGVALQGPGPGPAVPRRLRPERRRLPRDPPRAPRHLAGGHRQPGAGLSGEPLLPHLAPTRHRAARPDFT